LSEFDFYNINIKNISRHLEKATAICGLFSGMKMEAYVHPERWYLPARPYVVTTQNTNI
jgi:hypothetical protein